MSVKRTTEMNFWDHLEELRWRLVRMVAYVVVLMLGAWAFRNDLLAQLTQGLRARHPVSVNAGALNALFAPSN